MRALTGALKQPELLSGACCRRSPPFRLAIGAGLVGKKSGTPRRCAQPSFARFTYHARSWRTMVTALPACFQGISSALMPPWQRSCAFSPRRATPFIHYHGFSLSDARSAKAENASRYRFLMLYSRQKLAGPETAGSLRSSWSAKPYALQLGAIGYPRQTTPELAATDATNFSPDMSPPRGNAITGGIGTACFRCRRPMRLRDEARIRGSESMPHLLRRATGSPLARQPVRLQLGVCDGIETGSPAPPRRRFQASGGRSDLAC